MVDKRAEGKVSLEGVIKKTSEITKGCVTLVVAGPPGTGKSTFCAQVIPTGKTLVIATLGRELQSWLYQKYNPDCVLLEDNNWKPSVGSFEATAFDRYIAIVNELLRDESYENVIVDNGTELAEAAWRKALSIYNIDSTAGLEGRAPFAVYEQLGSNIEQAVRATVALSYAGIASKPKNVLMTWHVQPAKDDTVERDPETRAARVVKSADHVSEGVEYEGKVLPMVRGNFRRKLAAFFSHFVYCDIHYEFVKEGVRAPVCRPKYVIQVVPTADRHTKLTGPVPSVAYIPNSWEEFVKLIPNPKP